MRRRTAVLVVVSVVVATGCLSFGGPGGPNGQLPPGVAGNGSVNESALLAAHAAAVENATVRLTASVGDGQRVVYRGPDAVYADGDDGVTWTNGGLTVTNATAGGADYRVTYARNTSFGGVTAGTATLTALTMQLGFVEYEHEGSRTVNGTDRHELTVSEAPGYATGTLVVDERGRIHRLSGESGRNESAASDYEYAFEWGVEAVPRPGWVDAVPRATAAKTDDGTAVVVRVTGGAALPAGTTVEFTHDGRSRSVTLNRSVSPGDALAFALRETGDGRELVVSRRLPESGDFVDLRGSRTSLRGTATLADGTTVALSFAVGPVDR